MSAARWRAVDAVPLVLLAAAAALFIAFNVSRFNRAGEPFSLVLGPGGAILHANPQMKPALSLNEPVDLSLMTLRDRLVVASTAVTPYTGEIVRVFQGLPGRTHEVVVRVKRSTDEHHTHLMIVGETLGSGTFLVIATLLAFRRPGAMTLYLLVYGVGLATQYKVTAFAPDWVLALAEFMQATFGTFMPYALLIFACLFPYGRLKGWLAYCVPAALILGGLNVAIALYADVSLYVLSVPTSAWNFEYRLYEPLEVGLPIVICAALVTTYLAGTPAVRQRVKWLVAATLFTQAVYMVNAYLTYYGTDLGVTQSIVVDAELAAVTIPALFGLVLAYVVLRYNVMNVGIVVSRTFVLGVFIAVLVAAFVTIEWFVGRQLHEETVALVLDACVALVGAFIFASSLPRLEQAFNAVFLQRRLTSERQLRLESEGLQSAGTEGELYSRVAEVPVRVLDLTGSAVFTLEGSGIHAVTMIGLKANVVLEFVDLQAVASLMRSRRRTVSIAGTLRPAHEDVDLPAVATPLTLGRRVKAFALYGAHRSGEDVDDVERRTLDVFARAAAAVYEHLEVEALHSEILLAQIQDEPQATQES
jgi:hypothetical protein